MGLNYFKIVLLYLGFCLTAESFPHLAIIDRVRPRPVHKIDNRPLNNWMEVRAPLIGNLPITGVFLPGSHDSATYKLEHKFGKNQDLTSKLNALRLVGAGFVVTKIAQNWAQAQGDSISQQLANGVRYLDLRVIYRDSKKEFYTVHGLYGPKLKDVLSQIKSFLLQNTKEILVIQVGDLRYMPQGAKNHDELAMMFKNTFGDLLVTKDMGLLAPLTALWSDNKRIFVIYNDNATAARYPFLFSSNNIFSFWANVDNVKELKEKLDGNLNSSPPNQRNLYVIQSQLTANGSTIKNGLKPLPGRFHSLRDMAKAVDKELPKWIEGWFVKGPTIIMTDFSNGVISQEIIALNDRQYAKNKGK